MGADTVMDAAFVWSDDHEFVGICAEALNRVGLRLQCSPSLDELRLALFNGTVTVILAQANVEDKSWTAVFDLVEFLEDKPSVVVVSNNATPEFWAEALNRGAYDVVSGASDEAGLASIVQGAHHRFQRSREVRAARRANAQAFLNQWPHAS